TPKWVKLAINGANVATVELMSVPFAFQANRAFISDTTSYAIYALQAEHAFYADSTEFAKNGKILTSVGDEALYIENLNGDTTMSLTDRVLQIRASTNEQGAVLGVGNTDIGFGTINGPTGNRNVSLGSWIQGNNGHISVHDSLGSLRAQMHAGLTNPSISNGSAGLISTRGENGTLNTRLGSCGSGSILELNRGNIAVFNEIGANAASMKVNSNGDGVVEASGANGGIKSFVMPHPTRPGKEIVYACIEGPEVAAYERGTATLVNGEAEILFSEHFELVINPGTLTISTSPWSAKSKGLAVVERTARGFKVKELFSGLGNYQFDWEAKAVRKGHEDFKVIRNKQE
ncbi:MAG: hypothetical protein MRZ79_25480, partial [Bacteroidia bacterium]|nr:hypothetical protein [Bacteroidia bacterium]